MTSLRPWETPATGPMAATVSAIAADVPVLTTARLTLRAPRVEDFPAYAELLASPRSTHVGGPFPREAAWDDFLRVTGTWALRGFGMWGVDITATGQFAGLVGPCQEFGDPEPELGWMLTEQAEGHGYATEAARAALAHCRDTMRMATLVSYVDPTHERSIAVALRLGARLDPEAPGTAPDVAVYRHLPEAAQ